MKTNSSFAKLTVLALLVATLTVYVANRAGAAADNDGTAAQSDVTPTTEFEFGGISIGRGQTANIIAILKSDPTAGDQEPFEVEFMFHDQDGNLLDSSRQTLLPGQLRSFDTHGIIAILRNKRTSIAPSLKVIQPNGPRADRIVATLEVSDADTGKTQFAVRCRKAGGDQSE